MNMLKFNMYLPIVVSKFANLFCHLWHKYVLHFQMWLLNYPPYHFNHFSWYFPCTCTHMKAFTESRLSVLMSTQSGLYCISFDGGHLQVMKQNFCQCCTNAKLRHFGAYWQICSIWWAIQCSACSVFETLYC